MALTCKLKIIISAAAVVVSTVLHSLDLFGLIPFFVLVISFFTLIIQGALYLTGYKNGDVFEAYQDMERTEATALTNLFTDKKDCKKDITSRTHHN